MPLEIYYKADCEKEKAKSKSITKLAEIKKDFKSRIKKINYFIKKNLICEINNPEQNKQCKLT